jgi:hypothetical protein
VGPENADGDDDIDTILTFLVNSGDGDDLRGLERLCLLGTDSSVPTRDKTPRPAT